MSSEREKYLAICQTCSKSKFDRQRGLVCGLTNAHANFDLNQVCPDYENDEKFTRIQTAAKKRVEAAISDDSTAVFWRPASIVFITIGAILFLFGTINFLWVIKFGFSPIGLFCSISGLVLFTKGLTEFNKLKPEGFKQVPKPKYKDDTFDDFDDLEVL